MSETQNKVKNGIGGISLRKWFFFSFTAIFIIVICFYMGSSETGDGAAALEA
ncbi:MAG: hypothetical protein QF682_03635 [Candidatus Thermoplasmatota archaeon]|jgi:hypothetical protein|nr:hypothetical protein [Candidatus Thermoplasmatota archaeon]